jgi:hypothetical protein
VTGISRTRRVDMEVFAVRPFVPPEEGSVELSRNMCVVMPVRARSVVSVVAARVV